MYTPLEVPEYYSALNSSVTTTTAAVAQGTRLRPDVVIDGDLEKSILSNAPYHTRNMFTVPRSGKLTETEDS